MKVVIVFLVSLQYCYYIVAARRCLQCDNVPEPVDCQTITECGHEEVCFVRKKVTTGGQVYYDLGCRSIKQCSVTSGALVPVVGKRFLDGTSVCNECCNDKDICNFGGLCGTTVPALPSGSNLCYECPLSKTPGDCNHMTLCNRDSACSVRRTTNIIGDNRWIHGCKPLTKCASHDSQSCSYCCRSHLCNKNCSLPQLLVSTATTTTSTTTMTTTTTTIPTTTTSSTTTPTPLSAPIVTKIILRPATIRYGNNETIMCIATGNPPPFFDFLYRGASLAPNVEVIKGSNALTITNYGQANDGEYRCVAANLLGVYHRDIHLQGH